MVTYLGHTHNKPIKYERVYLRAYETVRQARQDIAEYIGWYNDARGHSSIGNKTLEQVWTERMPTLRLAA